jgi:hypothetical protein
VAKHYKKKVLEGENNVILIYQKCYTDLLEYNQELKDQQAMVETAGNNRDLSNGIANTLCETIIQQNTT